MLEEKTIETPVEPAFSHLFTFPLDPFQTEAIDHIRDGKSVMVAAPTSSGKTVVAEYALWRALQSGSRAVYTTPIKALSNQKRRDLEELFPGQVGLLTGDRSENPDAPIVVMTTEVLRNMLVEDPESMHWVTCVVFDEVHYLADPQRGTVWEEAIITCPQHVQLVCLSATIANADEIAAWISATHREIALVRHDERPVPLEHYYYTQRKLHVLRDGHGQRQAMFPREGKLPVPHTGEVLRAMARMRLLPAIWFAFSRRAVEEAAQACAEAAPPLDREQRQRIESAIGWTLSTLPEEDQTLPQLSLLVSLLRNGVGFHHAGLLPPFKELVERLFIEGSLSVVCATDTLAVGINMPARSVVISSLSRPFGGTLTPNDFRQLTGRAGRRGIDDRGAVVMLPSPYHPFEETYRKVYGPLQPIESTFRLRYSTLLSAMEGRSDRLDQLVSSSLRQYQIRATVRRAQFQLLEVQQQLAQRDDPVDDDRMQEYLQLQSQLSLAEKEQKRARNARSKGQRSAGTDRRYQRAREERERLAATVRNHPLHGLVSGLERTDADRVSLLRRVNKLQATIEQAQQECEQEASETADAVRAVLWTLRYVDEKGLTERARGLREIVAASGIVLSEIYHQGTFDRLAPAELAEVMSWFACDVERRKENKFWLPKHLQRIRRQAASTFGAVSELEEDEGIELAQGPSTWFYGVAYAWCEGSSVGEITQRIAMGEGDIVGMLNKTIDLLDQFEGLLRQYRDDRLLDSVVHARKLLVRGLVAMMRSGDRIEVVPSNVPAVVAL